MRKTAFIIITVLFVFFTLLTGAQELSFNCEDQSTASLFVDEYFTTEHDIYCPGESIEISYSGTGVKDWIAIFPADYPPTSAGYLSYKYAEGSGTVSLTAPSKPGEYVLYLFQNNGYTILQSKNIVVNYFKTESDTYYPGDDIVINYGGTGSKDWIALFPADYPPTSAGYLTYKYAEGSGTVSLTAPSEPGDYVLYLFQNNGYTLLQSKNITVSAGSFTTERDVYYTGEEIVINYDGTRSKDWIAIFPADYPPTSAGYLSYKYAEGSGTISLTAPSNPGDYVLYLFQNNGYTLIQSKNIVVKDRPAPEAPSSVSYVRSSQTPGIADGVFTILPSENITDGVLLYFGTDSGKLDGYGYLGYAPYDSSLGSYTFTLSGNILLPEGATHILAYGVNGSELKMLNRQAVISQNFVSKPLNIPTFNLGTPRSGFEVISDLHVCFSFGFPGTSETQTNNDRVALAFDDIAKNRANTAGVMVVGDMTNHGSPSQYNMLSSIIEAYIPNKTMYYTVGNHEFLFDGDIVRPNPVGNDYFEDNWNRFREFSGWNDDEYYRYSIINGDYFIFMGMEDRSVENVPNEAWSYYSKTQLEWLRGLLQKAKDEQANAFIFSHQSIDNTVSGSFQNLGQIWSGVNDDEALKAVIESYENTFFFTGHSHWNLRSYGPFINGGLESTSYFNAASAGYLWCDDDVGVPGSEGLFVDVYDEYVVVRGRDFENQEWIPGVQVLIPTSKLDFKVKKADNAVCVSVPEAGKYTLVFESVNNNKPTAIKIVTSDFNVGNTTVNYPSGITMPSGSKVFLLDGDGSTLNPLADILII